MSSRNTKQSFGDPICFTDFIASMKNELNTRQFNTNLTIVFRKNAQYYDAMKKSVKPLLSNCKKNDLIFTQLESSRPINLNGNLLLGRNEGIEKH